MFFCSRIKSGCRFIQEEKSRIRQKLYRNAGTLFLSTGQTADISILMLRKFYHTKHFFDPLLNFLIACILRHLHFRRIIKHLLERDILIDDILLWYKSNDIFERLEILMQICAIAIYMPGHLGIKATHRSHQSCLSSAGTTDDCNKFICPDTQADFIQNRFFATLRWHFLV